MEDKRPWERRNEEGERSGSYDAFKVYLHLGKDRSLQKVCDETQKSFSLIRRWSHNYEWVARTAAYDSYIVTAPLDGMVHALAESRDKNLALMDKLRGLLDTRLDDFIARREDPTIRWTQAVTAMAKIEANSLLLGKEEKTSERLENVETLMEKIEKNLEIGRQW